MSKFSTFKELKYQTLHPPSSAPPFLPPPTRKDSGTSERSGLPLPFPPQQVEATAPLHSSKDQGQLPPASGPW